MAHIPTYKPSGHATINATIVAIAIVNITTLLNGSIIISPNSPVQDNKVTITVKPNIVYVLSKLTIIDNNNNAILFKDNVNGTYTYMKPRGCVYITATLQKPLGVLQHNGSS